MITTQEQFYLSGKPAETTARTFAVREAPPGTEGVWAHAAEHFRTRGRVRKCSLLRAWGIRFLSFPAGGAGAETNFFVPSPLLDGAWGSSFPHPLGHPL